MANNGLIRKKLTLALIKRLVKDTRNNCLTVSPHYVSNGVFLIARALLPDVTAAILETDITSIAAVFGCEARSMEDEQVERLFPKKGKVVRPTDMLKQVAAGPNYVRIYSFDYGGDIQIDEKYYIALELAGINGKCEGDNKPLSFENNMILVMPYLL